MCDPAQPVGALLPHCVIPLTLPTQWELKGIRATVRPSPGHEKCQVCGSEFNPATLACDAHPASRPERCCIDVIFNTGERGQVTVNQLGEPLDVQRGLLVLHWMKQDIRPYHSVQMAQGIIRHEYLNRLALVIPQP